MSDRLQVWRSIISLSFTLTCLYNILRFFSAAKMTIFSSVYILIFAQNIDCGYTL